MRKQQLANLFPEVPLLVGNITHANTNSQHPHSKLGLKAEQSISTWAKHCATVPRGLLLYVLWPGDSDHRIRNSDLLAKEHIDTFFSEGSKDKRKIFNLFF